MCARRVTRAAPKEFPCRSEWGYKFRKWTPPTLHKQTIKAAKRIGLDMGAADILYKDGVYYFLELNSAPSVDHSKITHFYQKYIPRALEAKYPNWKKLRPKPVEVAEPVAAAPVSTPAMAPSVLTPIYNQL